MTKIMIDGVDVSGCEQYIDVYQYPNNVEGGYIDRKNICECGNQCVEGFSIFCKENNCNYKQLKRKEDECEVLEFKVHDLRQLRELDREARERFVNEINQLEYQLQAEKQKVKEFEASFNVSEKWRVRAEELNERLSLKAAIYKQSLEEIKKIAGKSNMPPCLKINCNCETCHDDVTNDGQNCMQRGLTLIQQKCEVLDKP